MSLPTITVHQMRTAFFVESDRDRSPRVILNNKVPMGLYIPCTFDENGNPLVEEVCQQIRDLVKED